MLPTNAKPVTDRSWTEDEALYDVVEQLGTVVKTLRLTKTLDEINKLVADHHPEEALILCEQVITIEPQHAPTLRQKGEILFVFGRYQESLDALNQVQQSAPQIIDTEFYRKQAQTLEHLQQHEEALKAYDQAFQLHPRNIHVLQEKAALLQKLQRLQEALSTYEKLTQLDTTNAFYYQTRGNIYLLLRRPQDALAAYKQALQYDPDNVDVYKKQGEVLLKLQQYKEAQSTFEQAIRIAPQDASLHYTLGKSLLSLHCYQEALAAFQTSIGLDSHNPYCYHGKGLALFALEEYKAALNALDQALYPAPTLVDPQFYHDQARIYEQLAQQAYQQEQVAKRVWTSSEPDFFVNAITIDNLQNITTLHTLTGHTYSINSIAFSPDGHLLASGSDDKNIKLWDPQTGKPLQTLTGHTDTIRSVAFSPDGHLLASGCYDNTIRLWDPQTGKPLQTLTDHTSPINSVAFSPDGHLLASGS